MENVVAYPLDEANHNILAIKSHLLALSTLDFTRSHDCNHTTSGGSWENIYKHWTLDQVPEEPES